MRKLTGWSDECWVRFHLVFQDAHFLCPLMVMNTDSCKSIYTPVEICFGVLCVSCGLPFFLAFSRLLHQSSDQQSAHNSLEICPFNLAAYVTSSVTVTRAPVLTWLKAFFSLTLLKKCPPSNAASQFTIENVSISRLVQINGITRKKNMHRWS